MLIGVDIIDIERIKKTLERTPSFLDKVFTPQEREYCLLKRNPYPSLAARFAAKEAVRKLDPAFISGLAWNNIEVINSPQGKPEIILHGQAQKRAQQINLKEIKVSLSHSNHQAIAAVIAVKEDQA